MVIRHLCIKRNDAYGIRVAGTVSRSGTDESGQCLIMEREGRWSTHATLAGAPPMVDLSGTFAAPALYDAHVHLYDGMDVEAFCRYGVGKIRDLGSGPGVAAGQARVADCQARPETIFGGPMLDQPGTQRLSSAHPWRTEQDLPAFISQLSAQGASWVKVYAKFPPELLPELVREAHYSGLKVAAHVRQAHVRGAVVAGVDEIEHLAPLIGALRPTSHRSASVMNAWSKPLTNTELGNLQDMLERTAVCPTLAVHQRIIDILGYGRQPSAPDPALAREWAKLASAPEWTPEETSVALRACCNMAGAMAWLIAHGAGVTVGSDTPNPGILPGAGLWDEINVLAATGIGPFAAYLMASVSPQGMNSCATYDLAFLSRNTVAAVATGREWPVQPVRAITRKGCLFMLDDVS